MAFEDINPQAPFHVLVIPCRHISTLNDAEAGDEGLLGRLVLCAARLAREHGHAADGYRTVFNCNRGAGQTVFHIHLHLLAGRSMDWPRGRRPKATGRARAPADAVQAPGRVGRGSIAARTGVLALVDLLAIELQAAQRSPFLQPGHHSVVGGHSLRHLRPVGTVRREVVDGPPFLRGQPVGTAS